MGVSWGPHPLFVPCCPRGGSRLATGTVVPWNCSPCSLGAGPDKSVGMPPLGCSWGSLKACSAPAGRREWWCRGERGFEYGQKSGAGTWERGVSAVPWLGAPRGSSCAHAAPPGPSPAATSRRTHGSLAQLSKAAEAFISPKSSSQHRGCTKLGAGARPGPGPGPVPAGIWWPRPLLL